MVGGNEINPQENTRVKTLGKNYKSINQNQIY
jgi:hypothetical protein